MIKRKGFTLIELLIVIAIIGLLATLAIISLTTAQRKARDTKRIADMKSIQTAAELYFSDQSTYPAPGNWTALQTALSPYISQVPVDPNHTAGTLYAYGFCTAGGNCATSDQYFVGSTVEDPNHTALNQDDDAVYGVGTGEEWAGGSAFGIVTSTDTATTTYDCTGANYCLSE